MNQITNLIPTSKPIEVLYIYRNDIFWHGPILLLYHSECLGGFGDFTSVEGDRVDDNAQYIIPELNFSCDGTVTQWKVGIESSGNSGPLLPLLSGSGSGNNPQSVNLQIWRPVAAGEYSLANEVTYTKMDDETIASVPVSMSVMAGDLVGFYVPGGQLQPHTLPGVGLTMYTTDGSFTSSLSELQSTVGPSPYISVVFSGENNCTFVKPFLVALQFT